MFRYIWTAFVPILITKNFVLYFGLNYSKYPGEGYGWGLAASMAFTLASFGYFIWVHRFETEDSEPSGSHEARRD